MKIKKIMSLCVMCTMFATLAPNIAVNAAEQTDSKVSTVAAETKDTTGFVKSEGTHFTLDGKPFYFEGTNNYYLTYAEDYMVNDVFEKAEKMGLKVMRTWGFIDGTEQDHCGVTLQPKMGEYNEDGFKRFDYVIQQAKEHGIKLVIPFVNNWTEFGGTVQYSKWTGINNEGDHCDEFYSDPTCKQAYKDYIKYFLNRTNSLTGVKYKDDPTIMTWELANEPRVQSDSSCEILTSWIEEMSDYIKSIDPDHLVAIGDEGFFNRKDNGSDWAYNGSQGVDWDKIVALPSIDYGTYHLYPTNWTKTNEWGTQWIKDHIEAANALNKPAVLEEYGVKQNKEEVYKTWGDTILEKGGAGSMFWILTGVTWGKQQQYADYDGFNVNYADPVARTLTDYAAKMEALNKPSIGDVNGDGSISLLDYTLLRRYISTGDERIKINEKNSDINGDSVVDFYDLIALKNLV